MTQEWLILFKCATFNSRMEYGRTECPPTPDTHSHICLNVLFLPFCSAMLFQAVLSASSRWVQTSRDTSKRMDKERKVPCHIPQLHSCPLYTYGAVVLTCSLLSVPSILGEAFTLVLFSTNWHWLLNFNHIYCSLFSFLFTSERTQ